MVWALAVALVDLEVHHGNLTIGTMLHEDDQDHSEWGMVMVINQNDNLLSVSRGCM